MSKIIKAPAYLKYKDVEVQLPDLPATKIGGEVKLEAFRGVEFPKGSGQVFEIAGSRREAMPWSDNIILDQGLDWYDAAKNIDQGHTGIVGTSNTAEAGSQTGCIAPVAYSIDEYLGSGNVDGAQASPPYYGWRERKYRYTPGFGGGNININEVCVATGEGLNLSEKNTYGTARALTRDGNGDPTSIAILADEYLDFYYRRRQYPGYVDAAGNPIDGTGTIDIGGVSYGYTIRCGKVLNDDWGTYVFTPNRVVSAFDRDFTDGVVFSADATMGSVTGEPSASENATIFWSNPNTWSTYVAGTHNQTGSVTLGLDQGNVAGGIAAICIQCTRGYYQVVLDAPVPKTNTKIFTYYQNYSWARKAL